MEETKEGIEWGGGSIKERIAVTEILRNTLGWWGASGATRNWLGVDLRTDKSGAVIMEMIDRGLLKETTSCLRYMRYFRATVLGQERAERVCPQPIAETARKVKIQLRAGNCGLCAHWRQNHDLQFGDCRTAKIVRREWGPGIEFHEIAPDCAVVENDEGWGKSASCGIRIRGRSLGSAGVKSLCWGTG